ncbi:MAG: hypothetical protein ACK5L5_04135 [Bacteroidales bacterium]
MPEEKKTNLPKGITAEMIVSAKAKHGDDKVKLMELIPEDATKDKLTVLACAPSRKVIGQYRRFIDADPMKADEIIVKACVLSHKETVLADDALFNGAKLGILQMMPVCEAVIKNL